MIVLEPRFFLLVAGCWISLALAPSRFRPLVLTVWGLAFYAVFATAHLPLIVALTLVTHFLSSARISWPAIALLLGGLAYVKLHGNIVRLAPPTPLDSVEATILVPLGFSYLVFELVHVAVERRRQRVRDTSLLKLAAFALFFPCRVAGPLKRYNEFTSAVANAEISLENVYRGSLRIMLGVFKKVALADVLGLAVSEVTYAETSLDAWRIALAYSLQIYLDFSAYSDIAIGASRILGIRIPENFSWPYLSRNIQEFWARWHITFSFWLRDYVFNELGRKLFRTPLRSQPHLIAVISYVATFTLAGAWHGLTPGFLAWGAYHGLLLSAFYLYRRWVPAAAVASPLYQSRVVSVVCAALTFFAVTIGWVFFIADVPTTLRLLGLMFRPAWAR